ncbi:MAG: DUF885 family protein, partial [Vicinamibacterales bacterium]
MSGLGPFFESYYRLRPVNATFTGVHQHDDRLPDWSPEGLAAAADEMRSLRASLGDGELDAAAGLGDVERRDRQLAASFLDVQIAEIEGLHFQRGNPSLALAEAVFGVISLITRPFAPAVRRSAALAVRLQAIPAFLAGARRSMVHGVPDQWRARCLQECEGATRLLRDGVGRWLAFESLADDPVRDGCAKAMRAVDDYRRWLTQEVPAAPAARLAIGSAFFDLLLRRGHHCTRGAAALAADASGALDDALEMLERRARAITAGGYVEVQARLAEAHPTVADYLATYQRAW